jgi:hypothetical protein
MIQEIDLYDENLKQSILDMPFRDEINQNNMILIPESDYGFAEIFRMYNDILVFLIPTYGGTPSFYKSYARHNICNLIDDLKAIT